MDSTVNLKVKTTKGKRVGARFLVQSILEVEGRVGAPRWRLKRLTSNSIIHTDLHKPNNKLVNVQREHFWCMNEAWANMDS